MTQEKRMADSATNTSPLPQRKFYSEESINIGSNDFIRKSIFKYNFKIKYIINSVYNCALFGDINRSTYVD